jgi:quercetin dioxygenase-like cupin family protein
MSDREALERRDFLRLGAAAGVAAIGGGSGRNARAQDAEEAGGGRLAIRRVVTGHDENGRSVVTVDEPSREGIEGREGLERCLIWSTGSFPADNVSSEDGGDRDVATVDPGGTVFRVVEYSPGVAPRRHRTQSIDYAVVISGEIDMELDEGAVRLRQGDVLVQRGTIHNWVNRGSVPCVIAFVLVAAAPVRAGGSVLPAVG